MRILIVFGGPSLERAISLNSARSLADHLYSFDVEQSWVFVSQNKKFHVIDKKWLYCNTIEDFEFKLSEGAFWDDFKKDCSDEDVIFSVIHGEFGEDGEFSSWLEDSGLSFIGPSSKSCYDAYLKEKGLSVVSELGLAPGPYVCLHSHNEVSSVLATFVANFPDGQRFFMKPNAGGSSIGARPFSDSSELLDEWQEHERYYQKGIIVEPFYENAQEFCITVFAAASDDEIYCLAPVSIDYGAGEFYDYRKKYMLSDHSHWECPAQWPSSYLEKIQQSAKQLYRKINARGLIRIDGWIFEDGRVAFSDINLISGFEQNSLLFRQAAVCGLSHQGLCRWLIENLTRKKLLAEKTRLASEKKNVFIVFGGDNSERYTSMLSGINVWLKLISQKDFDVVPYLWEPKFGLRPVPYHAMLSHGLQGLRESMDISKKDLAAYRLSFADLSEAVFDQNYFLSVPDFLAHAKRQDAFVFLALHGGDGENGVWQSWLVQSGLAFNGSGPQASAAGMDKKRTAEIIESMSHPKINTLPKVVFSLTDSDDLISQKLHEFQLRNSFPWILKPRSEGCSSGVMIIRELSEISAFIARLQQPLSINPSQTLTLSLLQQWGKMENCMTVNDWLVEPMVVCDRITFASDNSMTVTGGGWIELTQGVIQEESEWKALPASLVLARESILTVEEKFQSGTGTNVTPVPFFTQEDNWWLSRAIIQVAEALSLQQYARFDLFYNRHTRDIIVIEVNTLPGLTASTVLFHQLILDDITPQKFFAWLLEKKNQPLRLIQQNTVALKECEILR